MNAAYPRTFISMCNDILSKGVEELGFPKSSFLAIVSRVEREEYKIVAVQSATSAFVAGESFHLSNTFCREVVSKQKTVAITEVDGQAGLSRHPLYQNVAIEGYIGTPIYQNEKVWGTLNFSCLIIRREPFNESDFAYIENEAKVISSFLSDLGSEAGTLVEGNEASVH